MKLSMRLLILILSLCLLSGCGTETSAPAQAETQSGLMLVESRPATEPTVPETNPQATLPDFIQQAAESKEPTAPTKETVPQTTEAGEKPRITKQPTAETIQAGEEAWFVARAENTQGIRWLILDPDDPVSQDPQQIAVLYPELVLQGLEEETLILSNVPQSFSGMALQAEFYNENGSSFTQPAVLTVTVPVPRDPIQAYGPVLENSKYIQQFDPNLGNTGGPGPEDVYGLYESRELLGGGLGYALEDLNEDGIPELIIGCPGTNSFGIRGDDMVFALFTLQGDQPVKLLQSRARSRNYLTKNGGIYQEVSGSASVTSSTVLAVNGGRLEPLHALWKEEPDSQGISPAYYVPQGNPAEKQLIPESRFYELQSDMLTARAPLPPLTDILPF